MQQPGAFFARSSGLANTKTPGSILKENVSHGKYKNSEELPLFIPIPCFSVVIEIGVGFSNYISE
jgi:hypothetical protein